MDLLRFLSPKHVILVHGEKPKMAALKRRVEEELGIPCYHPANNEAVSIPSSHSYLRAEASHTFLKSSSNPNFEFKKYDFEDESGSLFSPEGGRMASYVQVSSDRARDGYLVLDEGRRPRIVLRENRSVEEGERGDGDSVGFGLCCFVPLPLRNNNSSETGGGGEEGGDLIHLLYQKLSVGMPGVEIVKWEKHIAAKSVRISYCSKDGYCVYRRKPAAFTEPGLFFCSTWSAEDDDFARKLITVMEESLC